jgi:LPS export ABC transporter protein LptC
MYELQMTHKEYDKVEWELSASKALFPMDKKEIQLKSIDLTINYSPKIYITSDNGTYEVEKGNMTLSSAVEFNTEDAKFTTDTLKWNSKNELVTTQDAVKFIGKSFFIEGKGLTANINQQKIRILKNVKAVFYH